MLTKTATVFAQHQTVHEIDSVMDLSPAYLPTYYSSMKPVEFESLIFKSIDTGMTTIHQFDPLFKTENIYQSLGIMGQAHQSVVFNYQRNMGFSYQMLPYPLYFKKQSDLRFYKLQTNYTRLAYTFGLPKENEFFAEFAQYIKGVTVSFNLYAIGYEDAFSNPSRNLCGDLLLHYETPSSLYGFKASAIINHLNNSENGGLKNADLYKDGGKVEYRTPRARSTITEFDIDLQNYVNLKNHNSKYFGTFTHNFQFNQTTQIYRNLLDTIYPYYGTFFSGSETNDSTRIITLKNALQWSNFAPYKEMNHKSSFFHIAGGALHDYAELKYSNLSFNSLYLFTRTHIRLFKLIDITAKISYSIYGHTNNDILANIGICWTINRENEHLAGLNANFYNNTPEYIMLHVESNHFRWATTFSKQNIMHYKAFWSYKKYNVSVSYYNIENWVYLSEELRPMQHKNIGNLIQIATLIPFRYKNFGATSNLNLQYCTHNVVNLPLFAGKLSVFYIFEFLKKRLKILIGSDLMYNTPYSADGYLPALHKFYHQNSQITGNFLYWDANVTFQIDRINFFFRIGNVLPPFLNYRNFTTPNYPTKDYLISFGITWRFFD